MPNRWILHHRNPTPRSRRSERRVQETRNERDQGSDQGFRSDGAGTRTGGRRIYLRHSGRGESRSPREPSNFEDQADHHSTRTSCGLHGRDGRPIDGKARCLSVDARARCHESRDRGGLCPARRDADDDDHGPEANQAEQASALPDHRRGGDDGAGDEIRAPDRSRREYPLRSPRSRSTRRRGAAGRGDTRRPRREARAPPKRSTNPSSFHPRRRGDRPRNRRRSPSRSR